jgi:peptidoglycan hydrolase-like protein with peptidoglycan-binding domain
MPRKLPVAVAVALSLTLTANAAAAGYATRTLEMGSSGSDVRALQRYLDRAGYETTPDGAFGPATRRSVKAFERAEQRRANGRASRAEQRMVRARASAADGGGGGGEPAGEPPEEAYLTDDGLAVAPASAPDEVRAIIEAGNAIATKPYKYGGGHQRWNDRGYDCSGSVSYALHGAGLLDVALDSSGVAAFGKPGAGRWVSLMGNPGHAYMVVAGLRFDTSSSNQTGNRWTTQMRSTAGYVVRHPQGL